ncbi:MAG: hypothetical protein KDJ16_17570, partial [Hyphomicrobiales bacterium]|nr:hypothetical protein [Hyphomicrobiales bacterium]
MGIAPIIHCLVDQEPTSFHQSDIDEATFSFAINLGFECQSNAKEPADVKADETAAEAQFRSFLDKAQGVRFFLFALPPLGGKLGVGEPIASISQPPALGKPDDLYKWLGGRAPEPGERYWTTAAPQPSSSTDVVVEAESAAATYCLRAAQSWNAPVAHAFGLTHVVRVARKKVESKNYVILPFFDADPPADITFTANHQDPVAVDFSYKSVFGPTLCRTNPIGEGLTKALDPSTIDPALTSDGYLKVYADADPDTLRRTLVWFEERSATALAANPALHSHAGNPDKDPAIEDLFGIQVVETHQNDQIVRDAYWGSIVW